VLWGSAAPAVSSVVITPTHGRAFRVGVVTVGDERLFAFALGKGQKLKRWTAYDAAGRVLSSGSGSLF
jgi:F420-0:gamma-glutamyl ligase